MWTPGPFELVVILAIVVLVFGTGKIAGLGKSMGTAISEFKDAVRKDDDVDSGVEKTSTEETNE